MNQRLAMTFVLVTLVIDAMGIGLILPVWPALIQDVRGGDLGEAAAWGGLLATGFALMQFIFGPILGSLSDAYGRRPILMVSLGVMAVDYLVLALASSLWLIFVARVVGGITAATMATCNAFVSDISKPEEKAARFGLVGAAFGMGFVLGPLVAAGLVEFGTRAPFYAAAALTTLNLIFGYFVLPETVTDKIRRPFSWARANAFVAFEKLSKFPGLKNYLTIVCLYEFAFLVYPSVWAYFTPERFGWDERMVSLSLVCFGLALAVVQGGLIRIILGFLGERGTVLYGLVFNFCAFLVLALLVHPWLALAFTPITALGAVVTPALQGLMSNATPPDQQGELQGVISSAKSLAYIGAPFVMTQVFFAFTRPEAFAYVPGAPFALSAALMVACGLVFVGKLTVARRS